VRDRDGALARVLEPVVHVHDAALVVVEAVEDRRGGLEADLEGARVARGGGRDPGLAVRVPHRAGLVEAGPLLVGGAGGDQVERLARVVHDLEDAVLVAGGAAPEERREQGSCRSQAVDANGPVRAREAQRIRGGRDEVRPATTAPP
jgi:hypothetical protein